MGPGAPPSWRIIEQIVREAFAVVEAEGVQLQWSTADEYLAFLKDVHLPATARHHSSMLQDLTRSRTTEIGFINGAVVEKGRAHGIPPAQCLHRRPDPVPGIAERGGIS